MPEGPERRQLQKATENIKGLCAELKKYYGSREDRTKDPLVREVEEIFGVEIATSDEDG